MCARWLLLMLIPRLWLNDLIFDCVLMTYDVVVDARDAR